MKITKFKDYRINFELDGLHYSLSDLDSYDGYSALICKENNYVKSFDRHNVRDIIEPFLDREFSTGTTYTQAIYIERFENFIRDILAGVKYEDTISYKERCQKRRQEEIAYHLRCLKELGYDLLVSHS